VPCRGAELTCLRLRAERSIAHALPPAAGSPRDAPAAPGWRKNKHANTATGRSKVIGEGGVEDMAGAPGSVCKYMDSAMRYQIHGLIN
jgi:hypothetical protein